MVFWSTSSQLMAPKFCWVWWQKLKLEWNFMETKLCWGGLVSVLPLLFVHWENWNGLWSIPAKTEGKTRMFCPFSDLSVPSDWFWSHIDHHVPPFSTTYNGFATQLPLPRIIKPYKVVGKDCKDHPGPTPLPWAGDLPLNETPQSSIQLGLEGHISIIIINNNNN